MHMRGLVWRAGYLELGLAWGVRGYIYIMELTGVRSLLSSSVAEAAASIRSSQRLPRMAAAACGSAEKAFRS